jgi:hypothetical protein
MTPYPAPRVQQGLWQGKALPGILIPDFGKDLQEEPGPGINICGTEKPLRQGKVKIPASEPKGKLFCCIGFNRKLLSS